MNVEEEIKKLDAQIKQSEKLLILLGKATKYRPREIVSLATIWILVLLDIFVPTYSKMIPVWCTMLIVMIFGLVAIARFVRITVVDQMFELDRL